jgi:replication factor C subunit 3/5
VIECEKVKISDGAYEALLQLSKGDMRRALNVLQACHASVDEGEEITDFTVYECVGNPHPDDIQRIMQTMMKDDWQTTVHSINLIKQNKGLALADILSALVTEFLTLDLKPNARVALMDGLSEIEWRLSSGGNEKIQTSATVGVVKRAIEL